MSDIRTSSSIAFFTFIAWFVALLLLDQTKGLTGEWTTIFQAVLVMVLFGFTFSIYFKSQKQIEAYETSLISGAWVLVFELVLFLMDSQKQTYNYMNWILPLILIVSIVYGAGLYFKNKKTRH